MADQPFGRKSITAAAVVLGLVLIVMSFRDAWVSTVTAVLVFLATLVYVFLTYEALRVTQEQFRLLKIQNDRQDKVLLFVDLSCEPPHLLLHVFNLGLSDVLARRIVVRSSDTAEKPQPFDLHRIVESGKTETVKLPEDLCDGEGCTDFEFTVDYIGITGPGSTAPKSFNVYSFSLVGADHPPNIKDGLDAPWYAYCPKCTAPVLTDIEGLKTFEVAQSRRKLLEEDLALSCPDHRSDWMLTVEKIKEGRRVPDNTRKL